MPGFFERPEPASCSCWGRGWGGMWGGVSGSGTTSQTRRRHGWTRVFGVRRTCGSTQQLSHNLLNADGADSPCPSLRLPPRCRLFPRGQAGKGLKRPDPKELKRFPSTERLREVSWACCGAALMWTRRRRAAQSRGEQSTEPGQLDGESCHHCTSKQP